ncbi:uncharacterized protein LOC106055388 isoform X1 [Biomphalaria glabrata]|uniref:Uncharacterized protein LOC106055388 isoform X1 n=1 Tax=Biomphalaria glabrata TaxID=6526 RepID=A0A2C9KEB7_BIOGL|nr:uncharacterized protein LOC106055388 isoform X1 [Biomphalaria glabrata]XP_013067088.1 uncharacterized protein LOC106055388 isoform X1 [Biomphalaria glabrata]
MAYRMPTAGVKTQESDMFRFNMVYPPLPRPQSRQEWVDPGCSLRPKFVCKAHAGSSDTALHKQSPMQAKAHLLHPAGVKLPESDMFRHYHVVPTERILRKEMREASRKGTCYNDGVQMCCPEISKADKLNCRPITYVYQEYYVEPRGSDDLRSN